MVNFRFYLAGGGAGALTSLLDLLKEPNQGTVARVGRMLKEHLFSGVNLPLAPALWGVILIVGVSLFVCWAFEVTSQLDGFQRGCTILAAFSIGAPGPIINKQLNLENGFTMVSEAKSHLDFMISNAMAQGPSSGGQQTTSVGEVYVVLDNLKTVIPRPDSTVTIRNKSAESIAIFKIVDNTMSITQPYGQYTVQVQTPGFANISFDVNVDSEAVKGYSVSAPASSVPPALQKLLSPTEVQLTANEAEQYKQLGRKKALARDFAGAVDFYRQSLARDSNDGVTHNYLGYAYFRLGRYAEAVPEFQAAISQRPDYKWAPINLIKVDCAQQNYTAAREKLEAVRKVTSLMYKDDEFKDLCKPILPR